MLKSRATMAAVAVAAVAIAGCSSSSNASGNASSSSPDHASGGPSSSSGTPINVGVVGSYGGVFASTLAPAKLASQAWAESVNAAGGINGHKINLIIKDDLGNASTAVTYVKELVQQDHVVAIVGEEGVNPVPWADYIKTTDVPVVGGSNLEPAMLSNPSFFSTGGNALANFYGIVAEAAKNGTKLGNLYCAESPACALTQTLFTAFGPELNVSAPYSSKVSASTPDFTSFCQGLKGSGAESYSLGLASATLTRLAAACTQQGYTGKLVISDVADSTFSSVPGLAGTTVVDPAFPFFDTSIPATQAFHAAIAKFEPKLGTAAYPLNSPVASVWAAGKLFEAAVLAAGTGAVTPASVKQGLYALKGETLGGLTPPLTFTAGQANPPACYFVYQVGSGDFKLPNGLNPTCVPAAALAPGGAALKK